MAATKELRPQPGFQEDFLSSSADVVVGGGSAGAGKSYALLLESTRHVLDPNFTGIIFRRTSVELTTPGGLWDTARTVYSSPDVAAEMIDNNHLSRFPSGARIKFSHLQHEKNKFDHHGGQYAFIGFDELTTFSKGQFFYLLTRNRPAAGCRVRPYCRATCNPDADSWVRELLDWWIDPDTGYAIPERSGVIRYFTFENDVLVWVTKEWRDSDGNGPKSFTFIPGSIDDNKELMEADPTYKATLRAKDHVTKERLLKGNWNVTYKGGMFNPTWFRIVPQPPPGIKLVRYWDFAASEQKENTEPDWTVGALCGIHGDTLYIVDIERGQWTPAITEERMKRCAEIDGKNTEVGWEEEHGSSGKFVSSQIVRRVLQGYVVRPDYVTGNKIERAKPWAAMAEHGGVALVAGEWNRTFLAEAGSFPLGKKDQIDAVSGAYKLLTSTKKVWENGVFKFPMDWSVDFVNLDKNTLLLCSQWMQKDRSSAVLMMTWNQEKGVMTVYDEYTTETSRPEEVIPEIVSRLRTHSNGLMRTPKHFDWYGNDAMFGKYGGDMSEVYSRYRVSLIANKMYDERGSIAMIDRLMQRRRLIIHNRCDELYRQMCEWEMGDTGAAQGYAACRALCNVASAIYEQGVARQPRQTPFKPYTTKHTKYQKEMDRLSDRGQFGERVRRQVGIQKRKSTGGFV